jgi:hypothetical protein
MGIEATRSSREGGIVISVPTEGSKCPNMRRYLQKVLKHGQTDKLIVAGRTREQQRGAPHPPQPP